MPIKIEPITEAYITDLIETKAKLDSMSKTVHETMYVVLGRYMSYTGMSHILDNFDPDDFTVNEVGPKKVSVTVKYTPSYAEYTEKKEISMPTRYLWMTPGDMDAELQNEVDIKTLNSLIKRAPKLVESLLDKYKESNTSS